MFSDVYLTTPLRAYFIYSMDFSRFMARFSVITGLAALAISGLSACFDTPEYVDTKEYFCKGLGRTPSGRSMGLKMTMKDSGIAVHKTYDAFGRSEFYFYNGGVKIFAKYSRGEFEFFNEAKNMRKSDLQLEQTTVHLFDKLMECKESLIGKYKDRF